jgi:hypothetical protein
MAHVPHVAGYRGISPATAAQQELALGQLLGWLKEKLLHPLRPVGQVIPQKPQVTSEGRVRRDGIVNVRVYCVVYQVALSGSQGLVTIYYRISAAVGQDKVVLQHQS